MSALGIPRHIATLDPRNVEHVLKSKVQKIYVEKDVLTRNNR
jgi:hypothetical protein